MRFDVTSSWMLLALGAWSGCTGTSPLIAQLEGCELVTDGAIGTRVTSSLYAPDACYETCLAEASCEALSAALCRTDVSILVACDQRCAPRCGDGTLYGAERRCDGSAQCLDGADERGCPGVVELTCRDGTRAWARRCDGVYACGDGTDEDGCTTAVDRCDDGTFLYPSWRCDGYRQCDDGSDEARCPTYSCDDGSIVTHRAELDPRCDGWSACSDGSDERGCASLMLRCF